VTDTTTHIVMHYSGYRYGGIERVISLQVPILREMGWGVSLLIDGAPPPPEAHLPEGCTTILLSPQGNLPDAAFQADRRARIRRHLIVTRAAVYYEHAYRQVYEGVVSDDLRLVRELGLRVVCHWHNSFSRYLEFGGDPHRCFRRMRENVDVVVCLSRVDACFFGMRGLKAAYLPNPVDPKLVRHVVHERSEPTGRIVWCGRFSEIKNPLDAVRIAGRVRATHPEATLLLLGAPDGITEEQIRAEANRVGAVVRFGGQVRDVYEQYDKADVFLSTSAAEGFPMVFLEAMLSGLPVICYGLPYLEVLRQTPSIRRVSQGDVEAAARAISDLISDRRAYRAAAEASRAAAERFSSFDQAAAYAALFEGRAEAHAPWGEEDVRLVWDEMDAARWRVRRDILRHAGEFLRLDAKVRGLALAARLWRKASLLLPGWLGVRCGRRAEQCYAALRFCGQFMKAGADE